MSTNTKQPIEQAESGNLVKPVLANRLFKPIAIDYNLGSVNGFDRVNIGMKNNKYLISFYMSGKYGGETFFEIKDAIIGGMGFLANEQDINNHFKFYESYDECIEVLKKRNMKNLTSDFDKFKIENSRFLLAVKTQTTS
jgi:hypothetical protein